MTFSPKSAALEGFRLTRREPLLLLAITIAYVVVTAFVFLVDPTGVRQVLNLVASITPGTQPSVEDQMALMQAYSRLGAIIALPGFLLGVLCQTAISRAALGLPLSKLGYFQPGRDQLKVLILSALIWLLFVGSSVIGFVVVGLLTGLGAVMGPIAVLPAAIVAGGLICALIWLSLKLSLAVPFTVQNKRVALRESFNATKGHCWPLFGMALLAMLLSIAVSILLSLALTPFIYLTGDLEVFQNTTAITGPVVVAVGVWILVNSINSAAQMIILYAPFTAAWKAINEG